MASICTLSTVTHSDVWIHLVLHMWVARMFTGKKKRRSTNGKFQPASYLADKAELLFALGPALPTPNKTTMNC